MIRSLLRSEWIKLRSVRGWAFALAGIAVALAGIGLLAAGGTVMSCSDGAKDIACPQPPAGPGGEAVDDRFTYVHQALDGDGSLTAHIASFTGIITYPPPGHDELVPGLVPWAKAGLMIKDGTRPGAAYASVLLTGKHGVRLQHNFTHDRAGPSSAGWLRLTRSGDTITGYASDDGAAWTEVGSATLDDLPRTVRIGLFATSPSDVTAKPGAHGGNVVQARFTQVTAVFDHVDRTGGWTAAKIGDDGMQTDWEKFHKASEGVVEGDRITVSGSGDIAPAGQAGGLTIGHTLAGTVAALLVAIVIGAGYITAEYRRGIIRTTFAATPSRGRIVLAKAVVLGAVTFVAGLAGVLITMPLALWLLKHNGTILLPAPAGLRLRLAVGTALVLSLAAVLAYGLGAVLKRGVAAVAVAVGLTIVPYLLSTASVLPAAAAQWLLRVTPAAAFAIQQSLPAYPQVALPYEPSGGYYPLAPWAGLGVLALWAATLVGLAVLRTRRDDA